MPQHTSLSLEVRTSILCIWQQKYFSFSSPLVCGACLFQSVVNLAIFYEVIPRFSVPTRRGGISGTWSQPAATLTLTLRRTDYLCLLYKPSFQIYVRENIPVFRSLQELVFLMVHGSLFIIFRPSHVHWWALSTAAWRFSFLEVSGHCRAKLWRIWICEYTAVVNVWRLF